MFHIDQTRQKKSQVLFAIALLMCTFAISAFHYHESGKIEDKCPICKFQNYDSSTDSVDVNYATLPELFFVTYSFLYKDILFHAYTGSAVFTHAPPSLS